MNKKNNFFAAIRNSPHNASHRLFSGRILSFFARLFAAAFLVISLLFPVACNNRDSGAEEALPRSTTAEPFVGNETENDSVKLVEINTRETVEHLFTHNLISHPEIAFAYGNTYGKNLDEDCLTPKEFRAILNALHQNGYALVNATETFAECDGGAHRIPFLFPENKKPLILSFDDIVYARKNQGKGTSSRLITDDKGNIFAETFFKDGTTRIHGEEFAPILEDFIGAHPDFSYHGARGIIFLTGFDGVLGYRTDRNSENRAEEIQNAAPVIAALKNNGWLFGCHSYSHRHIKRSTPQQVRDDISKWKNEVEPLVGSTSLYAYPYGEWVFGENGGDERQKTLRKAGFNLFFGVGNLPFYTKMPLRSADEKYLFQDRCPMDGISLRKNVCGRFFDCAAVYDSSRPMPYK